MPSSSERRLRPPPPHAPHEREVIAHLGDWEVRQFPDSDPRLAYFAERGFAHLQLWHAAGLSILTPSRLTHGNFELWHAAERRAARRWPELELHLASLDPALGVAPPGRHSIRALERWFVLPVETRAGRLLRSWWAGAAEHAR